MSGLEFVAVGALAVLLLIKLGIAIAAVVHLLRSARPTEQKLLWTLVILLVPLAGPLLYFIFGRRSQPASTLDDRHP